MKMVHVYLLILDYLPSGESKDCLMNQGSSDRILQSTSNRNPILLMMPLQQSSKMTFQRFRPTANLEFEVQCCVQKNW